MVTVVEVDRQCYDNVLGVRMQGQHYSNSNLCWSHNFRKTFHTLFTGLSSIDHVKLDRRLQLQSVYLFYSQLTLYFLLQLEAFFLAEPMLLASRNGHYLPILNINNMYDSCCSTRLLYGNMTSVRVRMFTNAYVRQVE